MIGMIEIWYAEWWYTLWGYLSNQNIDEQREPEICLSLSIVVHIWTMNNHLLSLWRTSGWQIEVPSFPVRIFTESSLLDRGVSHSFYLPDFFFVIHLTLGILITITSYITYGYLWLYKFLWIDDPWWARTRQAPSRPSWFPWANRAGQMDRPSHPTLTDWKWLEHGNGNRSHIIQWDCDG